MTIYDSGYKCKTCSFEISADDITPVYQFQAIIAIELHKLRHQLGFSSEANEEIDNVPILPSLAVANEYFSRRNRLMKHGKRKKK